MKTHFYSPVRRNALADDIQGKMNEFIKVRLKKKIGRLLQKLNEQRMEFYFIYSANKSSITTCEWILLA